MILVLGMKAMKMVRMTKNKMDNNSQKLEIMLQNN